MQTMARVRYEARAGTRHAGHVDGVRSSAELWNDEVAEPVAGGWRVVEVSTGQPVDVAELVALIEGPPHEAHRSDVPDSTA